MLALLVLIGCLHLIGAAAVQQCITIKNWLKIKGRLTVSDIPRDPNYVIRQNVSCLALGIFFEREVAPNSLDTMCHLCFCRNNDTAVCWKRNNRKCDLEHYRDFGHRNIRNRRSPLNFGQIFLRDAARDFFNKQSPEECKPFESSFSDGCPPADWCIGCTVCDCDAGGHWDCHVLSFCTDKKGKKVVKRRREHPKRHNSKRQSKISTKSSSTKLTTKSPKKVTKKRSVNTNMRRNQVKKSSAVNKQKMNQVKAKNVNKYTSIKKPLPNLQVKKSIPSKNKVTKRPLYIKKNVSPSKPINIKSNKGTSMKNNTVEVAQKVVKQFMSTMQKMIKSIDSKTNKTTQQVKKALRKSSIQKQDSKKGSNDAEQKQKFVTKQASYRNIPKPRDSNKYRRIKRQMTVVEQVSQKSDLNHSYNCNTSIKSDENPNAVRIQNLTMNIYTSSTTVTPHILSNTTSKLIQMKNSMNRDIYITNEHILIENQQDIVHDGILYHSVNNTNSTSPRSNDNYSVQPNISNNTVKDFIPLITNRPYSLPIFIQNNNSDDMIMKVMNSTGSNENITKKNGNVENPIYKNNPNASVQTEIHRCPFRTLLQKVIGTNTIQYNQTKENSETSKKPKRYTILTKIKRLLKKIFNRRNRNKLRHTDDLYYGGFKVKESDFKKSSNLKLNSNEKQKLRQRIFQLKSESENILKTIGIIKGLLHILHINTNETKYNISGNLYGSNENSNKLNIIVKKYFYQQEYYRKLSQDQQTQIGYIKNNVQEFIRSIGKFGKILDDVIRIAMCHNKKEYKIENTRINKNTHAINDMVNENRGTTYNKLEQLKKLVFKYNLLQNKFIHQIYVILNNLDTKLTENNNLQTKEREIYYTKPNKTDAMEINSANIIKNIRKLKLLAERINIPKRRKRNAIDDDDALEYLLVLMEYLLKRHSPVYPSVNDGLDLLIDAIKSAPDIKLIRKKFLITTTQNNIAIITTTPIYYLKKYTNYSKTTGENIEYSPRINKKMKIINQSEDDEDDDEEKIEEIYRNFKSHQHFSSEQNRDSVLLESNNSITSESYSNIEDKATTRISRNRHKEKVKFNTVHGDLEEETTATTSNFKGVEFDTTSASSITDGSNNVNDNVTSQVKGDGNTDNLLVDSKANIDWIEENFKEIKQSHQGETKSSTPKSLSPTRTHKHIENISDVSNENKIYNEKKVDTTSTEEIMSKKQLDLLNSLDYVEEEVESKDDKFSSDTYV